MFSTEQIIRLTFFMMIHAIFGHQAVYAEEIVHGMIRKPRDQVVQVPLASGYLIF